MTDKECVRYALTLAKQAGLPADKQAQLEVALAYLTNSAFREALEEYVFAAAEKIYRDGQKNI